MNFMNERLSLIKKKYISLKLILFGIIFFL